MLSGMFRNQIQMVSEIFKPLISNREQVMPKGAEAGSQAVATGVTSADGSYSIGPLQVRLRGSF